MEFYGFLDETVEASGSVVSEQTDVYSDKICAKEVRLHCVSGSMSVVLPYVTSSFETDLPTAEYQIASMTTGGIKILPLMNAGAYRLEAGNNSDVNPMSVKAIFSVQDSVFKKPIIKKGIIKRTMNGVTRRSA
jgi:hypothetical protein